MNDSFLCSGLIHLRPVEPEDADFMWEVDSDSRQWIQNSICGPLSKENLLQYAISYDADPFRTRQLRLIISGKDDRQVGVIDLYEISSQHRTAKIGLYILPACRHKGYGLIALRLMEDYCYRILNLRSLCADIAEDNKKSCNLFLKAGYFKAGELKNWLLSGHNTFSVLIYQKELIG